MSRLLLVALLPLAACGRPDRGEDAANPDKTVVLQAKGSDTMVNLLQRLSEEYAKVNPKVVVAVTGGGSGTGIKAIIDGTTDMANASRAMKDEEITTAKAKGVDPVETALAYDGLSIYVHKDNPVAQIDFDALKAIYGSEGTFTHWKQVGVTMDCGNGDDVIVKVGRQNNSGTYEYFKEHVIGKEGKFTSTMDQSGTQQVVDVVGTTKCAIGYGGMGYSNPGAKHVCLSKSKADPCVEPTESNVLSGLYPFSRALYVYTNGAPAGATQAFLAWATSPAADAVVVASGFVPAPRDGATPPPEAPVAGEAAGADPAADPAAVPPVPPTGG